MIRDRWRAWKERPHSAWIPRRYALTAYTLLALGTFLALFRVEFINDDRRAEALQARDALCNVANEDRQIIRDIIDAVTVPVINDPFVPEERRERSRLFRERVFDRTIPIDCVKFRNNPRVPPPKKIVLPSQAVVEVCHQVGFSEVTIELPVRALEAHLRLHPDDSAGPCPPDRISPSATQPPPTDEGPSRPGAPPNEEPLRPESGPAQPAERQPQFTG